MEYRLGQLQRELVSASMEDLEHELGSALRSGDRDLRKRAVDCPILAVKKPMEAKNAK